MYNTDHIQMYVPFNSRGEAIELSQMKKSVTYVWVWVMVLTRAWKNHDEC